MSIYSSSQRVNTSAGCLVLSVLSFWGAVAFLVSLIVDAI